VLGWVGRALGRRSEEAPAESPAAPVASLLPDPDAVEPAAAAADPDAAEVRRRLEDARARLRAAIPPPEGE
jgi:hypothetical protein